MTDKQLTCDLPTEYGVFQMRDVNNEDVRFVYYGAIDSYTKPPLVRIHSSCLASEVFGALDCDCADQLKESMRLIADEGSGIVLHLQQEGRGHGLSKKINAVSTMQKLNVDTVESFDILNYEYDVREYKAATEILLRHNIKAIRLITNNPRKVSYVESQGIEVVDCVNTSALLRDENRDYLYSKNQKLDHFLPLPTESI